MPPNTSMLQSRLKHQIEVAFDNMRSPVGSVLYRGATERAPKDPELSELASSFQGRNWRDITEQTVISHYDCLPFFSDEAFHYFIPAYMSCAVDCFSSEETPLFAFVVYALNVRSRSEVKRFEVFSRFQENAVVAFLRFAAFQVPERYRVPAAFEALEGYWADRRDPDNCDS